MSITRSPTEHGVPPVARRRDRSLAVTVLGLLVLGAAVRAVVVAGDPGEGRWRLLLAIALAWSGFAVAVAGVRRLPAAPAGGLVVVGGIALQLLAMSSPPRLTDDFYRYAWDGRVQAAGISPYRYVPTDPALAALRTPWLFPPHCLATTGGVQHVCTRLNHPLSPTIYPPVAQAEFTLVHLVTRPLGPDGGRERTWQVLGAALAVATTLALLRVLRMPARGGPQAAREGPWQATRGRPWQAALWAWCPTVILEAGGNAHVDVLACLLVVLAIGAGVAGRPGRSGVLIGLAIATKLLPVLVFLPLAGPLRGRRSWLRRRGPFVLAAALTVIAVYLPHLLTVGGKVLGFLPGYLPEEGFDGRTRFPLLALLLPDGVAAVLGFGLLALLAGIVVVRADPTRPWRAATVLVASFLAVTGISYPWYALLLVPLVALDGRARWLAVTAAAYPAYLAPALGVWLPGTAALSYAVALVIVAAGSVWRRSSIGGRTSLPVC